jgi:hypothetical protein
MREELFRSPTSPAPWTPLPLDQARRFIRENEDATIEIVFPTVYDEDRSRKILDLGAAFNTHVISHERYAEQVAKELGFTSYKYEDEMDDVRNEMNDPLVSPPPLGIGDALAMGGGSGGKDSGAGKSGSLTPKPLQLPGTATGTPMPGSPGAPATAALSDAAAPRPTVGGHNTAKNAGTRAVLRAKRGSFQSERGARRLQHRLGQ